MPTYFSGDQKCKFLFRHIPNVINTSGKVGHNHDGLFTKFPLNLLYFDAPDMQQARKKNFVKKPNTSRALKRMIEKLWIKKKSHLFLDGSMLTL